MPGSGGRDEAIHGIDLRLYGPVPNPSAGISRCDLETHHAGPLRIAVLAADGRLVRTLTAPRDGGRVRRLEWDGLDGAGRAVAPGVYWITAAAGERRVAVPCVRLSRGEAR